MDADTDYIEVDLNATVRVFRSEGAGTVPVDWGIEAAVKGVTRAIERAERDGFDQPHSQLSIKHVTTFVTEAFDKEGNEVRWATKQ